MEKSVVITGGNRGIGRSLTQAFADAGYGVVVGSRNDSGVEALVPGKIKHVPIDVRNPEDHAKMVELAANEFAPLQCYVNNAGFSAWRPIGEIDDAFLSELLDTNLKGAFWGCQAASAALGDGGSIVNISSIAGKRGSANNAAYASTKFGMNGLTQSLAKELGPRNIRVNALCPVLVRTDGLVEALEEKWAPGENGGADEFLENFRKSQTAVHRLPTGEEVAAMAVFLASDAASTMTGQCINVDCGVLPQ